jgi:hypothetical protein
MITDRSVRMYINLASYATDLVIIYTLFRYGGTALPRFAAG